MCEPGFMFVSRGRALSCGHRETAGSGFDDDFMIQIQGGRFSERECTGMCF